MAHSQTATDEEVSLLSLLSFFLPLAGTSFIITVTHSMFDAGLARLPNPEIALASFAIAKSFVHIIENPISMIRHVTVAMTKKSKSFARVCRFVYMILILVTASLGVIAFSPIGVFLLRTFMGIEGEILQGAIIGLQVLLFLPIVSGLRNLYQGVAILIRQTPLVTMATISRLGFVALAISFLSYFSHWPGAALGAVMFAGGIALECLVLFCGVKKVAPSIGTRLDQRHPETKDRGVSYKALGRFFLPLSVTSLVRTLILPTVNAGLARTASPEYALAVFSVAWGFGNIWMGPINMMFHQCSLNFARPDDKRSRRTVKIFAVLVVSTLTLILSIFAFTRAGIWVLTTIIGVSEDLAQGAQVVLRAMCFLPALNMLREYNWGTLMERGQTSAMGLGKVVNFVSVFLAVNILFIGFGIDTPLAGIIAVALGALGECIIVFIYNRKGRILQEVRGITPN